MRLLLEQMAVKAIFPSLIFGCNRFQINFEKRPLRIMTDDGYGGKHFPRNEFLSSKLITKSIKTMDIELR